MSIAKISVDLKGRRFDVEVSEDKLESVLTRLEALFQAEPHEEESAAEAQPDIPDAAKSNGSPDKTRKRGKAAAKPRSYKQLDLGLTPDQRNGLRKFFAEKSPTGQNQEVAVIGVKLKEILKREAFSEDEIHTALKVVNRPTPRNLAAVFGNMRRDGRADYADAKVVINSLTDDYVHHHMSVDKKKKDK